MPSPAGPYFLGIDIGGTKLAVGLVTATGQQLSAVREASRAHEGPDRMLERLVQLSRQAIAEAGVPAGEVVAAGVGCGGPLNPDTGVVMNPPNLPGWDNVPVVDRLSAALGMPVYLDNDANAAALGEHRFGAGRGVDNLIYLTISTGLGGGIIIGGHLYQGENGNAGEIGHMSVFYEGRACGCGNHGCLEAYASGTSIVARVQEAIRAGEPSAMVDMAGSVDAITGETLLAALEHGDSLAERIWAETIKILGAGVASVVNIFNPRKVVLGGGITNFGDRLFVPLREQVAARAMAPLAQVVEIVPAALGSQVGVLGAAAVALARLEPVLA
ncbi:MAG: hypothetical protein K0R39_34 [Symbiobacteriaceae bacterium]|jgi:glucokinase|nr:hypothetical protein [Symbiobacteriaceae bacterium]